MTIVYTPITIGLIEYGFILAMHRYKDHKKKQQVVHEETRQNNKVEEKLQNIDKLSQYLDFGTCLITTALFFLGILIYWLYVFSLS